MSECPISSSENLLSTSRSASPHCFGSVSTSRALSPIVVVSQPAVVSSHPPVHTLHIAPRVLDTVGQAVRPPATYSIAAALGSQPLRTSATASLLTSRFRPPVSAVTGFQSSLNRATFPSTTGPSLHQLLSPSASAGIRSAKSPLPFSSSSPNLAAVGGGGKHVLVDSSGQVISTVLPPAGSGRRPDDGKLRKNSSVASGIASVSTVHCCVIFVSLQHTEAESTQGSDLVA